MKIDDLLERIRAYDPEAPVERVLQAYFVAAKEHAPQRRKTGEDYITHPLSVAMILAELEMDVDTIVAGLLHDVVEDTLVTVDEIRREFGETVAHLVEGVTKVGRIQFRSKAEAQAEYYRRMFVATARDLRVMVLKLADRLHNMRTIDSMPAHKQRRIARETRQVYAPIADRLGLGAMKVELEDLCFRVLEPEAHAELERRLAEAAPDRDEVIHRTIGELERLMRGAGLRAQVQGRVKHLASIHRKMVEQGLAFEDVHDLLAFRIIVDTVPDCYLALGTVHATYRPVPGRFKDYIGNPKANGYRSLHTVVLARGDQVEIQIRTEEMHRVAEHGVAAHWHYKQRGELLQEHHVQAARQMREIANLARHVQDPDEFMSAMMSELFADVVHVFSRDGDVFELPRGATVLDFAYRIHSEVGDHCVGARVGGVFRPISYVLEPGDRVEVVTRANQHPRRDWLSLARTGKARSRIRRYLREHEAQVGLPAGRKVLEAAIRKRGGDLADLVRSGRVDAFVRRRGWGRPEDLFLEVYRGNVDPAEVAEELVPEEAPPDPPPVSPLRRWFSRRTQETAEPRIGGETGVAYHLARCCSPVPGDAIGGYTTRGKGVTIHRRHCPQFLAIPEERRIEVSWGQEGAQASYLARLRVLCEDRKGMLADLSKVFAELDIRISGGRMDTDMANRGVLDFDVEVADLDTLDRLVRRLRRVDGVDSVYRIGGD